MSKELLQEIEDYLEYESMFKGKKGKLVSYKAVKYNPNKYYANLYEGGKYIYEESTNTYYYCKIKYE